MIFFVYQTFKILIWKETLIISSVVAQTASSEAPEDSPEASLCAHRTAAAATFTDHHAVLLRHGQAEFVTPTTWSSKSCRCFERNVETGDGSYAAYKRQPLKWNGKVCLVKLWQVSKSSDLRLVISEHQTVPQVYIKGQQ